ncbi:MAG: N-acetyltransferase [Pseudomonadales bacterium]|nr:N-acetyltransferase [Pseudomonadales bacterium]
MNIRKERASDIEKIWEINAEAFETDDEANLVNTLRGSGCTFISLVAEIQNSIVGHILFTPVELTGNNNGLKILGLAPMAVLSQHQNKKIGSELVNAGLEHCRSLGYDAIVVLGHPDYYPRFGFVPSVKFDIKSEYDVPDEVFNILELVPECLKNSTGVIKYHEAFGSV